MKLLVLYETKHGATAEVAEAVATGFGPGADVAHIAKAPAVLAGYDCIVFGAPVYMGRWPKSIISFIESRKSELVTKKFAAFALGLLPNDYNELMRSAFPTELKDALCATGSFGGKINSASLGFGEKLITSMVAKATAKQGTKEVALDFAGAQAFGRNLSNEA